MLTRRESRAVTLQTLFYLDFKNETNYEEFYKYTLEDFFDAKEERGKEVKRVEKDDYSFNLGKNILKKKDILDEVIKKAAPDWPLEKISFIDKNILRLGIYELLFNKEKIPVPVAINESIILSQNFNTKEGSDKFIAGVMGSVLEASGIEEDESRKWVEKEQKSKFGFMPYFIDEDGGVKVGLVFNIFNKWTLPKGSVKGSFKNEEDAVRDIAKRKLNAEGNLKDNIGGHSYSAGIFNDKRVIKNINYFLFELTNKDEVKISPKLEGLNEIKFFDLKELKNVDTYEDILPLFEKAGKILSK